MRMISISQFFSTLIFLLEETSLIANYHPNASKIGNWFSLPLLQKINHNCHLLKSLSAFQSLLTIRLIWGHWGRPRPPEVLGMILIHHLMLLILLQITMVDLEEALSLTTMKMLSKFYKEENPPCHLQRLKMYWTTNCGKWKNGKNSRLTFRLIDSVKKVKIVFYMKKSSNQFAV